MEDKVEVYDLVFTTTVPGLTLQYTIREHEGDVVKQAPGVTMIEYPAKDVLIGVEKRRLTGDRITVAAGQIVEVKRHYRFEDRVRLSARVLINREQAEQEALRVKLGLN